jgi:hypothetical protein
MAVRRLDDDFAAHDAVVKAFELGGLLANAGLDRRRRLHSVKADLQGYLQFDLRSAKAFHNAKRARAPFSSD